MDVVAINKWVEENFKLQYLAAAQKAFFSCYNKIPIKVDKNSDKVRYEMGFVDVEGEQRAIHYQDDVINMLKYIPPINYKHGSLYKIESYCVTKSGKSVPVYAKDKKGNQIKVDSANWPSGIKPEKWIGYSKNTKKYYELTPEFVNKNYSLLLR